MSAASALAWAYRAQLPTLTMTATMMAIMAPLLMGIGVMMEPSGTRMAATLGIATTARTSAAITRPVLITFTVAALTANINEAFGKPGRYETVGLFMLCGVYTGSKHCCSRHQD